MFEFEVSAVSAAVIDRALNAAAKSLEESLQKSWLANKLAIRKYVRSSKNKFGKTKTLLYKDKPVSLEKIYVGTRFIDPELGGSSDQDEMVKLLENGHRIVVSATAGAGKSVFAKYAFIALLTRGKRTPLMVELRHLNDTELGIFDYIGQELRAHGVKATNDVVRQWIKQGRFAVILDGYDELSRHASARVNAELVDLHRYLGDSSLLITTRPCDEVEYFGDWSIYRVRQLTRAEAVQLIGMLEYDTKIKDSFEKELRKNLYRKHRDFLSNPLLLTIMLMTYGEIAEIPSKMHVFYEHAFDVLFYRHDASKGMYRRKMFSGLAIDDFKDILSSVSTSGYVRSKISFSNTELLSFIRKAKKLFNVKKLSPENFKKDLLQSVCILIADGKNYTFNHRSFQEYFTAVFLVNLPLPNKIDIYNLCLDRGPGENALQLAFEMNQEIVEKEFVSPYLNSALEKIGNDPYAALALWLEKMELRWWGDRYTGIPRYTVKNSTRDFGFMRFAEHAYQRIAGSKMPKYGRLLTKKSFIEHIGTSEVSTVVDVRNLTDANAQLLENIGVVAHARKRLEVLHWIAKYLEERDSYVSGKDVENWL